MSIDNWVDAAFAQREEEGRQAEMIDDGRALVAQIEVATQAQPHVHAMLFRMIHPRTITEESEWIQWVARNCRSGEWVLAPRKEHVLPTLGADDPDDDTVYLPEGMYSPADAAIVREFPALERRGDWLLRDERNSQRNALSTHAGVHRELAGAITATRCQFCELSMLRLDDDCVRFVLRGLAHNNSATPATVKGLVSDWAVGARRFFKTTYYSSGWKGAR